MGRKKNTYKDKCGSKSNQKQYVETMSVQIHIIL